MQLEVIQRIMGILLMLFSISLFPPVFCSLLYQDGELFTFITSFITILVLGIGLWFPVKNYHKELMSRDGFIIVVMFWVVLGTVGTLPLILSEHLQMGFIDALFESFSGLTTTGGTVITHLDELPQSILYYRQQLQWLGGMGIIVLAVAILPMLGVGGMQLYRAETPGPMKDNKLTPRITETAKTLWFIYIGLTIACFFAYWIAGMDIFDAICHSFSTIATGGFSTHDLSLGYFNSTTIELIACFFMFIAGINFALHFLAFHSSSITPYQRDIEFKIYFYLLALSSIICIAYLYYSHTFDNFYDALHHGLFQTISIATTTGFSTTEFYNWPSFLPVMLLFLSFVGGCAGSTGGGIKVIRFILLFKQGLREIFLLIHPNACIPVKINNKIMPAKVSNAIWGFFALYVASFSILMLLLMTAGLDQVTAFSALAANLNNLGPGLGDVSIHYANINDFSKFLLTFSMLLGRLEIFTLLVIFTPSFWQR